MDPEAIATAVGAYFGLKDLLPRILGPTADYLGNEVRSYTEKGAANLRGIFTKAAARLGSELDKPGQVSPKVLKGILEEGYFAEDELAAEYFGGVLASSRTTNTRDDRGAAFVKLVSRLSVYQLRAHHIIYFTVHKRHAGSSANVFQQDSRRSLLKTYLTLPQLYYGLDVQESEDFAGLLPHIVHGLVREELIEDEFVYGGPDHVKKLFPGATEPGIVLIPSPLGIELFLWAYGKGKLGCKSILDRSVELTPLDGVKYPDQEKTG